MANDDLKDIFDEAIGKIIEEWVKDGLSEDEISKRLSQEKIDGSIKEMINQSSNDLVEYFKTNMYQIAYEEQAKTDEFVSRQKQTWGEGLAASQTMYIMAVEAAELYSDYVTEKVDDETKKSKQYTFTALQHLHGRACQIFLEIFHLIRLGFADGAYARWRSLYELCVYADFIKHQGEQIAKQYIEQSETDESNCRWAKGAVDENGKKLDAGSFDRIQKLISINSSWFDQYKLACFTVHGSPQGTFKRLANGKNSNCIPVGHSNYGIVTAAEHSAICLSWITGLFTTVFTHMDSLARCKLLANWIDVVRKAYFKAHEEAFCEKIE